MPPKEKRKLSHIFYVCYTELCKRQNLPALSQLKSNNQNKAILDICTDRIKYEEWGPILNALSHDNSLHFVALRCRQHPKKINETIDCEAKIRQCSTTTTTRIVVLTKFVLTCVIDSVTNLLSQSQFVTVLMLEGFPLSIELVQTLTRGLAKNKTLQHLNLQHCLIGDGGCEILSRTLRYISNMCTLDLSSCQLTVLGVKHLSELIKYQKISRYSESWKQTLRYREPDLENMCGLRRLTVNNNPSIGDDGLQLIIDVLLDDLWMKAIDFQNCGITDVSATKLADLLVTNGVIDIADVRNNNVSPGVLQNIMMLLCKHCSIDTDGKFQWINTTSSLIEKNNLVTSGGSSTQIGARRGGYPLSKQHSDTSTLRRPKEVWSAVKIPSLVECKQSVAEQLKDARSKIRELQLQLDAEKCERQKIDCLNSQLHSQLMHVMERNNNGVGDVKSGRTTTGGHNDGYVYIKKDVLNDIYKLFSDFYSHLPNKTNGFNKHTTNNVFNKLQSIIEESPPNSQEGRRRGVSETAYSQSPRNVNSSGDMQQQQQIQLIAESDVPRAQQLFDVFLCEDDHYDDDYDDDECLTDKCMPIE